MKRALAIIAALVLSLTAGCSRGKVEAGQARLTFNGRVLVAEAGQSYEQAKGNRTLKTGDRVKVLTGSAKLDLPARAVLEMKAGSEVRVNQRPAVLSGEVLALSGTKPLALQAGTASARVDGVARIERSLALSVATYTGSSTLASTGRSLTVPALRRATSPASGVLPARPDPIRVSSSDRWDRRFLGLAIDLNAQLARRGEGFSAQLSPTEGQTVGFFRQVLPSLEKEPAFTSQLMEPDREPGDTLIGASIAIEGQKASFLQRWASVFSFREDGAEWGIVAMDQEVSDVPGLTGRIDAAIALAPLRFTTLPQFASAPDSSPSGGPGAGGGPDGGGGGGGGGGSDGGSPPPTTQPPRPVDPPPTGTPADPLADTIADVINQLLAPINPVP